MAGKFLSKTNKTPNLKFSKCREKKKQTQKYWIKINWGPQCEVRMTVRISIPNDTPHTHEKLTEKVLGNDKGIQNFKIIWNWHENKLKWV